MAPRELARVRVCARARLRVAVYYRITLEINEPRASDKGQTGAARVVAPGFSVGENKQQVAAVVVVVLVAVVGVCRADAPRFFACLSAAPVPPDGFVNSRFRLFWLAV